MGPIPYPAGQLQWGYVTILLAFVTALHMQAVTRLCLAIWLQMDLSCVVCHTQCLDSGAAPMQVLGVIFAQSGTVCSKTSVLLQQHDTRHRIDAAHVGRSGGFFPKILSIAHSQHKYSCRKLFMALHTNPWG